MPTRSRKHLLFELLESRQMLTGVVINEIHFDPDDSTEQVEFIELYNDSALAVDLSGWTIDDAVDFEFADGTVLAPFSYAVITQNMAEFQTKFGFASMGQWEAGDRLSNEGERILILDASQQIVDEVDYQLGFPWPTVGDFGNSIELIHPSLDNDLAGSWRSSGNLEEQDPALIAEQDSDWRYRLGVSEPPSSWNTSGFNEAIDSEPWQTGQTSLGYGDSDDNTMLVGMQGNYTSVYLRHEFTITDSVPDSLLLRTYVDDGAIIYINGNEVTRPHVSPGAKDHDDVSGVNHEAQWEEELLTGLGSFLIVGTNILAIHALNGTLNSSDFSIDAELLYGQSSLDSPTPGAQNSVYAANAAPQMRQLTQSVLQPTAGENVTVTIKVTDPDGIQDVTLDYQLVDPGNYVRITDSAYTTSWTSLAMVDDGLNGDAVAGDDVYTVVLPGTLQVNRRLVRYRITSTDILGASVQGPYGDDPQPNFAYFVYDGVPDYTASQRPGVEPNVTYSGEVLDELPTYHLIADAQDVQNSQYNSSFNEVLFHGTLVYDGVVYDHVDFRNRGAASTYQVGKNKWKIEFLRGHHFQGRDNFGNLNKTLVNEINILPGSNPWWKNNVSTEGTVLFEPVAFKLYELAGTPAPHTSYFQFHVIDAADEVGGTQYDGDFWGLYINIEQPDGPFLEERNLPDGSIFNMHGGAFGSTTQRTQGSLLPSDRSDLVDFLAGIDGGFETLEWWEQNLNFDSYIAWNLINHAVNNSDIRPDENVNYYHNQETGQWYILPWDLDLTFEDAPHFGNPVTNRENIRTLLNDHPVARLAYENRLRELVDLLFNSNDAALVVEEFASFLTLDGTDQSIVDANQAQWDYHPQKTKKGIWYENFTPGLLPSEDFAGLVTYMQNYLTPGGYGFNLLESQGDDAEIPAAPTISYLGDVGFPSDSITFGTSAFNDPQGEGTFAAMEWRVAEVHNSTVANFDADQPYIYEIEGTWESGEITSFESELDVPASALEAGKTYRARVRMQDDGGHWSHWSDPIEFFAGPPANIPTLTITELHYHPNNPTLDDESDQEFIEILNTGDSSVDLSGVQIADFASTPYVFADGITLAAGQYIVVARNPVVFQSIYGTQVNLAAAGYADANLSNGGETITLLSADNVVIQSFTYDDTTPWPEAPDGQGPSLTIIDPLGDHNDPANWQASDTNGGSPGSELNILVVGDYDSNGQVNGGDFLAWQRSYGASADPAGSGADGNSSGVVDGGDLTIWQAEYGPAPLLEPLSSEVQPHSSLAAPVSSNAESDYSLAAAALQYSRTGAFYGKDPELVEDELSQDSLNFVLQPSLSLQATSNSLVASGSEQHEVSTSAYWRAIASTDDINDEFALEAVDGAFAEIDS